MLQDFILKPHSFKILITSSINLLTSGKCLGMQSDTIYAANAWGVSLDEKFLPQYLKSAGYKTHAIGKVFII